MFFWFPVRGQFHFQHEFVCTVVLHTPTNVQQSESRERQMKISCWNMHPSLVLVQTPCWSLYGLLISRKEGPDLPGSQSSVCVLNPLTLFNKRIASDPKISVPHEEPKARFRYTDLGVNVTDCSAACGLVRTLVDRALSSLT